MKKELFLFLLSLICSAYATGEPLNIPPLLEADPMVLEVTEGRLLLKSCNPGTLGYNGNYLGPTLMFHNGKTVQIELYNKAETATSIQFDGLSLPSSWEYARGNKLSPFEKWSLSVPVRQEPATLWYHPYLEDDNGWQTFKGLAGIVIIKNTNSAALGLPDKYGINDIPLIIQHQKICSAGEFRSDPNVSILDGYDKNCILVNGSDYPELEIGKGTYRLRLLNASEDASFRIRFEQGRFFRIIADGEGLLPESKTTRKVNMMPGDRYELLIDFPDDEELDLIADLLGGGSYNCLRIKISGEGYGFYTQTGTTVSAR